MKKGKLRLFLWLILLVFVGIQFIPVDLPENSEDTSADIIKVMDVPEDVAHLLKAACYDCHSDEVSYPWYSYVAPVAFLVERDVAMGKEALNLSKFNKLSVNKKIRKLSDIASEVSSKHMPFPLYPPLHPEARLSDEQRQLIVDWANKTADEIAGE